MSKSPELRKCVDALVEYFGDNDDFDRAGQTFDDRCWIWINFVADQLDDELEAYYCHRKPGSV